MEGAVGQMIIQTDGLPYRESRGNYGCLETYASIYALEQAVQSRLKQGRSCILNEWGYKPDKVTFSALVRALKVNDPLIVELFNQAATYFGIGLANLLNTLHPEKVVLGGALVTSHDLFFNVATKVAIKNTYYYPTYQVVFSKGKLGEDALATGAAVIVLNQLTE
jgi:predicted NBD/HSP70 family sugar kinase